MSMSRKQYRDISAEIRAERNVSQEDFPDPMIIVGVDLATRNLASRLATVFEIDNPRFDRNRFLEACGIE